MLKLEPIAFCNECQRAGILCVELGDEPRYESATATICLDCLRKAVALMETANEELAK